MTIATLISRTFDDDGAKLIKDGIAIRSLCHAGCGRVHSDGHDRERHVFPDGSAIVFIGAHWDIEGPTPFSWESMDGPKDTEKDFA